MKLDALYENTFETPWVFSDPLSDEDKEYIISEAMDVVSETALCLDCGNWMADHSIVADHTGRLCPKTVANHHW